MLLFPTQSFAFSVVQDSFITLLKSCQSLITSKVKNGNKNKSKKEKLEKNPYNFKTKLSGTVKFFCLMKDSLGWSS